MDDKMNDSDEILFSINEVAKIIGVVPATIRNWEKNGLFIARRKENNYRVYSFRDIEILKKIKYYSIDKNIGIEAIKSLLGSNIKKPGPYASQIVNSHEPKYYKKILSNKWKEAREKHNYTLEEVSSYAGISPSYLSKIENGQANVSYDILSRLANFYGESILYFFDKDTNEEKVVRKNCGEKIDVGLDGVIMESLVSVKNHVLYPMIFHVEPGFGSNETHQHNGEEFIYILSGKIEVILNYENIYILKQGDSMYFKSNEYHSWRNIGKNKAKLLWVHSPIESLKP